MLLAVCCWPRVADRVYHRTLSLIPLSSPLCPCCWPCVAGGVLLTVCFIAPCLLSLFPPRSRSRAPTSSHRLPALPPSRLPAFPPTQHDSHCSLDDPYVYRCPARPASHSTPACLPACPFARLPALGAHLAHSRAASRTVFCWTSCASGSWTTTFMKAGSSATRCPRSRSFMTCIQGCSRGSAKHTSRPNRVTSCHSLPFLPSSKKRPALHLWPGQGKTGG